MTEVNQQIILKRTPEGVPGESNFALFEGALPVCGDGQILVKNLYLSLDPYMRSQMAGRHVTGSVVEGGVCLGETISEVTQSKSDAWKPGDRVLVQGGWQSHAVVDGASARALDGRIDPPSLALGILGMPGLTAYAGLKYLGEPKAGDTLVVSAASGAVGGMVAQFGKALGCRVIGIAGRQDKCDWLLDEAGLDGVINYKSDDLASKLDALCPDGIDVYFDNVGGETLDTVMWRLAVGARVVLCGLISQINQDQRPSGPNPATIIKARATVRGLVVFDHWGRMGEMLDCFIPMIADGRIKFREDVSQGLAAAPAAFERLMKGQNFGKTIIRL